MPFERPTLQELVDRALADVESKLPGADTKLRRGNLQVLPRVHAAAVHGLYGYLDFIAKQAMPDSAEAEYLDRWAAIWGVLRRPAARATGNAAMTGTVGAVVPAGALFRRNDNARFIASEEVTFADTSAVAPVIAEDAGDAGNTAAEAVISLVSPITGVSTVGAVAGGGLSGGVDQEQDASLLARLLRRIQEPPHGGAEADYITWALQCTGVTRAYAQAGRFGAGTVGVTFLMDDTEGGPIPTPDDVARVQAYINQRRPVTADVTVYALTPVDLDFTIQLTPDNSTVRAAVAAELADLILREALPEDTLLISHIREAVSIAAGETDHVLTSPTEDATAGAGEIFVMGEITWT